MDDLNVRVSPLNDGRTAAFEVTPQEARRICNWLEEAKTDTRNTVRPSEIDRVYAGFKAIADRREFGGH
jgi:hypothetical protein